jgi:hypothetical protein
MEVTQMTGQSHSAVDSESLTRAVQGQSFSNYPAIIHGFMARGIPESEIIPRENVFTYNAWRALGRQVRKGEHGVKVLTFITTSKTDKQTGKEEVSRRPWSSTVFHVSQTDAITNNDRPRVSAESVQVGHE